MEGFALRCDEIFALSTLTADEKNAAIKAFDQCGSEYLKPVFDVLNGAVSYDDLKILRLYYLIKNDAARQSRRSYQPRIRYTEQKDRPWRCSRRRIEY
jgi:hypothetical protein